MSAFRFRPAAKVALLAVTVGVFATALPGVAAAQVAQCRLAEGVDGVYSGPCAGLDADVKLSLRPHATADGVWVGDLSLEGQSLGAVEVTAHGDDQPRVIKSQIGWNIVSSFVHDDRGVRLDFDTDREAPPTDLDLRIIRRASEILEMPANWDRADDRVCEAEDTTFSLYCSLHRASMDLVRAVGQPECAHLGVDARETEVVRDTRTAVCLDRIVDDLERHVGGLDLDHRDFGTGDLVSYGVHHMRSLERQ